MNKTYEIVVENGSAHAEEFVEWLNAVGCTASIGLANAVDGKLCALDDRAGKIMLSMFDDFMNGELT